MKNKLIADLHVADGEAMKMPVANLQKIGDRHNVLEIVMGVEGA